MKRSLLVTAALLCAALSAQDPEHRSKPSLPSSRLRLDQPAGARGILVVEADADCELTIDGRQKLNLTRGRPERLPIALGKHLASALPKSGGAAVKEVFTVRDPVEDRLLISFKTKKVTTVDDRARPPSPPAGPEWVNPKDGLLYVEIPTGSFQMGCVRGDRLCSIEETPQHPVNLSRPFYIGKGEVTVEAFERYRGRKDMPDPPRFNIGWRALDRPIVNVSWDDASGYCSWAGGRLPTEAEWEYAARGGKDGLVYPWGNEIGEGDAIYRGNQRFTYPAAANSGRTNGFGLFGAAGNVAEWCLDWYGARFYLGSPLEDPAGPASGAGHVIRGGSWMDEPAKLRVSARKWGRANESGIGLGFRCVVKQ